MKLCIVSEVDDQELLGKVAETIHEIYGIRAYYEVVDRIVEESDYNTSRRQYDAVSIVERVKRLRFSEKPSYDILLLVTDKDLYVDALNFVFGYAPYPVGIISTHRLNPEFYGKKFDWEVFLRRVLTEAVHEVGHLIGLKHCRNPNCVMFFSNTIMDTDIKGFYPCGRCIRIARERVDKLSPSRGD